MTIKNPYKLIEKANDTFNLYLSKYDEIEKYMVDSKEEIIQTKLLLNSFFEKYESNQEKLFDINFKFLDLFQCLINEDSINKKIFNNLESELVELKNNVDYNKKFFLDTINDSNNRFDNSINDVNKNFNDLKDYIDLNIIDYLNSTNDLISGVSEKQLSELGALGESVSDGFASSNDLVGKKLKDLKDYIDLNFIIIMDYLNSVNDLVGGVSEKQLGEIRALGESVSDGFASSNDLISGVSEKQLSELGALGESVSDGFASSNDLISGVSEKQLGEIRALNLSVSDGFKTNNDLIISNSKNQSNELQNIKLALDMQKDVNDDLVHAVKLYVDNYNECKRCFFNDNESLLKKYLNTDDLFRTCYFNNIKFLSYSPSENKILLQTKEGIIIATNNRFYTIKEVIGFDGYSVPQLYQFDDFIVFDIGMNRAYASLRFALFENCSTVYGFEIDEDTYNKAIYNINLNPSLSNKIMPFNMGLSNKNEIVDLYYLEGADGINTIEEDLVDIQYEMKENRNQIKTKKVEVRRTSEIIGEFIKNNGTDSKIVLKIDTEGSEYDIIDDLIESNLIYKIDLIVGEGHRFNDRNLSSELSSIGFKEIENKDNNIVYNFAFVKEEYYDVWPLKN